MHLFPNSSQERKQPGGAGPHCQGESHSPAVAFSFPENALQKEEGKDQNNLFKQQPPLPSYCFFFGGGLSGRVWAHHTVCYWEVSSQIAPNAAAPCLKLIMSEASSLCAVDVCPSLLDETADGLSLRPDWADGHQKSMVKALCSLWSKLLGRKPMKPRPF